MAQLAGNGILQFAPSRSNRFDELLPAESLVYFSDEKEDLLKPASVEHFHHADDAKRQAWAANARAGLLPWLRLNTAAMYAHLHRRGLASADFQP